MKISLERLEWLRGNEGEEKAKNMKEPKAGEERAEIYIYIYI